ncbi:MAG: hypothetical protein JJD97_14900 [Gemmatimonadaceae bacterium]|nr:hypothetical protein [Gemmatimonadaceae bacterium]
MSLRKLQCALPDLIGRTIEHIVVKELPDNRTQLFLFFTDGTHYEFYGGWLDGTRHLDVGGLEISRNGGAGTTCATLEVLDSKTTTLTERPPATPVVSAPTVEAVAAKPTVTPVVSGSTGVTVPRPSGRWRSVISIG